MLLRYFLKGLLLPPASLLILMLAGVLLRRRWPRLGPALAIAGFASLWGLSLPWTASQLLSRLETSPPLPVAQLAGLKADAIVVLSAGRYLGAPEFPGPQPDEGSLQRTLYAAFLARQTGLPVIATGGAVLGDGPSAATLMANSLREDFGIRDARAETLSRTTWENAVDTRQLLAGPQPVVVLVTHAWHMPRAAWSFRQQGFTVIEAPTRFDDSAWHNTGVLRFLPTASALQASSVAIHEWLGIQTYRWFYG